ncbi:MAG: hypothetical protein H7263_17240 [Candidatus Sericytochromatia bacterium]|nr:hypothetical protein [Candidatus Sericytochromatia bacterium]
MNQSEIQKTIEAISAGIPTLIAVAIVEIDSGMSLGSISKDPNFDPEIASAYNAEVVKQKVAAMNALGIGDQSVEDILITLSNQIHIIRLTSDKKHFLYMAAKKETNLAMARSVLKQNNI